MMTPTKASSLSQALEQDLVRVELTQKELGERLGISQQAISAWITDNHIPNKRLNQLTEVLGANSAVAQWQSRENFKFAVERDGGAYVERSPEKQPSRLQPLPRVRDVEEPARPVLREHTVDHLFRAALPAHLHANLKVRVELGSTVRHVDYMSDKLAFELISPSPVSFNRLSLTASPALLRLAVVRQATMRTHPHRKYLLGVHLPDAKGVTNFSQVQRLATEAGFLGVNVLSASDVQGFASLVDDVEHGSKIIDDDTDDMFDNGDIE